eukprot:6175616-Alexandrium_andersonii.AAC.1
MDAWSASGKASSNNFSAWPVDWSPPLCAVKERAAQMAASVVVFSVKARSFFGTAFAAGAAKLATTSSMSSLSRPGVAMATPRSMTWPSAALLPARAT